MLYLLGLGNPYAPTNGDEMVYVHIARMTAESGHWLPLQSELIGTRNTKPPLLIWQAMVAGNWGAYWNLFVLRLPSVLYTLATTALLFAFTRRMTGQLRTACIAAVLYLLFFSTFRYGRAYLTSAPETFWLALPMWWLLWQQLRPQTQAAPLVVGWGTATWFGIAMGLGAAYKSFALVAPTAATLWLALLVTQPHWQWSALWRNSIRLAWSAILGIGIFALWFAIDPNPQAVWQEFIVAENAGKMSNAQGYWAAAWNGAYPMWTQLYAYPANAGLLLGVVVGFMVSCVPRLWSTRRTAQPTPAVRMLAVWLVVWLVVFSIPSQRSERYLIPAMPALAILMAMGWERIHKIWFWLTLLVMVPALVMLGRITWVMGSLGIASSTEVAIFFIALSSILIGGSIVFRNEMSVRSTTLLACFAVYSSFGLMVAPLHHTNAGYQHQTVTRLQGNHIAVPNGFTGQYERFHFVLPKATIVPYDAEGSNTGALYPDLPPDQRLHALLHEFDAVIWIQDSAAQSQPSCIPVCSLVDQRWHVLSRHKDGDVTWQNLWFPDQWLFRHEWLLTRG
jgi:4-amino-4-deoxy-L-arabinose transferase-like glycosyltransferase